MKIEKRKKTETIYITLDNREFENKTEAKEHENYLILNEYHRKLCRSTTFSVTTQHIAAIKEMNFYWKFYSSENIDCCLDHNRPFGNSDIKSDLAKFIGIKQPDYDNDEYFTDEQLLEISKFFIELAIVLDILIATCELKPGEYQRKDTYDNWRLK